MDVQATLGRPRPDTDRPAIASSSFVLVVAPDQISSASMQKDCGSGWRFERVASVAEMAEMAEMADAMRGVRFDAIVLYPDQPDGRCFEA